MRILMAMLVFLSSVAQAEGWEMIGSLDMRSKYVGWSAPGTIVDEPVLQLSLTVMKGSWFAGTWVSLHADRPWDVRKGDEVDLFAGGNWTFFGVPQTTTVLWFNLTPFDMIKGDTFAVRNVATLPTFAKWTPKLMVEYNAAQDRHAGLDGWGWRIDFYRDVSIARHEVNLNLAVGGHDGEFGLKPEALSFGRVTITAPIWKGGGVTVSPYLMAQWGVGGMAENVVVGGIGLAW